ncbi:MAG: type VI secretion system tube protein Hcp [Methylobacter sp.]|nr:type VI secretion system tube protein Hcp [Methylobacter sp.]
MAVDMFLKIEEPPIKGESKDHKHKEEIDVLAWSWGLSNSGNAQTGGGAGAGKVNVQDLSITKYIDKSTTDLFLSTCNGQHYGTVTLTVRKAGTNPVEYVKITMNEVLVTSLSTGGSGGEDRLTENLSLNFAKVKVEFTPQKADGSADKTQTIGWDIAANIKH